MAIASARQNALLLARFGACCGVSWREVRSREAPSFSRERCHDNLGRMADATATTNDGGGTGSPMNFAVTLITSRTRA